MKSTKRANERVSFVFLDDFIIRGETERNVESTGNCKNSFKRIGLCMNMEKSKLEPCQELEFIGKVWNTLIGEVGNVGSKVKCTVKECNFVFQNRNILH